MTLTSGTKLDPYDIESILGRAAWRAVPRKVRPVERH
jgi:hypothetical protein